MNRVIFFVDGFNLYHALQDHPKYHKYKWLDLSRLASCYVTRRDQIVDVLYFTAYTIWNPDKMKRHQVFVRAMQRRGVKVIFGAFRRTDKQCRKCGQTYSEEQTIKYLTKDELRRFFSRVKDKRDRTPWNCCSIYALPGMKKGTPF